MLFERIQEVLASKNTTFAAVERELGFGNGSIKRWETSSPSVDKVLKLANHLNVSFNWLVTGEKENQQNTNLTENEEEMLSLFSQLSEREQLKTILKLEQYIENKPSEKQYIKIAAKDGNGVETIEVDATEEEINEAIRRIKAKSINNRK